MKNLAFHYSTETYGVDRQNDKIYAIYPTGWNLILEQARLHSFRTSSTTASVPHIQFQTTPTGTKLPVVKSNRVPRTSKLWTLGTRPVTSNVSSQDYLNLIAKYVAEAAIMEALWEEEQELDDPET